MGKIHLTDIIGNASINTQIMVAHGAARLHNQAMGHLMFAGAAGCGKTTTAQAVANLTGAEFHEVGAEGVKTAETMADLFNKFSDEGYNPITGEIIGNINPPVIFIDEAHRLTLKSQELLGIAMENFKHTYTEGRGKSKQTVVAWVPLFTLVCATTKEGDLSKPFRDRFKFTMIFGHYSLEESRKITRLHAKLKNLDIDDEAVEDISRRGRGTPRILVRLLDGARDITTYMKWGKITRKSTEALFELQSIDPVGLTETDISILLDLYSSDVPKGLDTLAVKTNLDPRTISDVNEPYMIKIGFIERTRGGRVITEDGVSHLIEHGHVPPPSVEEKGSRIIHRTNIRGKRGR